MDWVSQERSCIKVIDDLFGPICRDTFGKGGTCAETLEEQQRPAATKQPCALAHKLMEEVCKPANLNRAFKRVKANKGAPGVDGMSVDNLRDFLSNHKEQLTKSLLNGSFKPQPIRKVEIPKPSGGTRQLGIPTVVDRLVQQAIYQVLEPIFDKGFSDSSYGFRPKRSAHQALRKVQEYVLADRTWVVNVDLEKFFDHVNHDILMAKIAKKVRDKRLLKIIGRFLRAGIMQDGVVMSRHQGTPQGGPLSPLLSNILLDEVDKELEKRGHKFCRYADDINVYVGSKLSAERVLESLKQFFARKLKLKVNTDKSSAIEVHESTFLGYRALKSGMLTVAAKSIERVKDKVRLLTKRRRS